MMNSNGRNTRPIIGRRTFLASVSSFGLLALSGCSRKESIAEPSNTAKIGSDVDFLISEGDVTITGRFKYSHEIMAQHFLKGTVKRDMYELNVDYTEIEQRVLDFYAAQA